MDLKNCNIMFSGHEFDDRATKFFANLWDEEADNGQLNPILRSPVNTPYLWHVVKLDYSRPMDYNSLYFMLPVGQWQYPNAKDFLAIWRVAAEYAAGESDVTTLTHRIAEITATKWTASVYNAEAVMRAVVQLQAYMQAQQLLLRRVDVKPHNAWDAGVINQDTREIMSNTIRITCEQA